MHSPQRMQRERNSDSSSEPGGRSSRSWRPLPRPTLARMSGTAATPAAMPVSVLRRLRSGDATSFSLRKKRKLRLCSGQLSTQFMHMRHSDLRHGAPPIGSSPPWQFNSQRLQRLHFSESLWRPRMEKRDAAPSNAPSGQMERHHRRVTRRLAARMSRNRTPSTRPWAKCVWRKSRTVACNTLCSVVPVALMNAMWLCSRGVSTARTAKLNAGTMARPTERTSRLKGSSQPMAMEPKNAATRPAIRTTYFAVCQRL